MVGRLLILYSRKGEGRWRRLPQQLWVTTGCLMETWMPLARRPQVCSGKDVKKVPHFVVDITQVLQCVGNFFAHEAAKALA